MTDRSIIPAKFGAAADIAFMRHRSAIDVRLTRPQSLNALTHNMAKAFYAGLKEWAADSSITHVVISADTGEKRAFCAGGDIRDLYEGFKAGTPRHEFFRDEYRLNDAIATFAKPYIALMDGLVMGGGAGLSMHGSQRIVTENTRFAMPEVGIGLIPDVGGSYVLPRMKNHFGMFLGLSGTLIGPEECLEAQIATHYCNGSDVENLRNHLLHSAEPLQILNGLRVMPGDNFLAENAIEIGDIFGAETLSEVFGRFQQKANFNTVLAKAYQRMLAASPLSLCLAFEQLKLGKSISLRDGLTTEFRIVSRILHGPDLYEGIRAAVIDRSRSPKWQHETVADIDTAQIASFFQAPPEGDLTFET